MPCITGILPCITGISVPGHVYLYPAMSDPYPCHVRSMAMSDPYPCHVRSVPCQIRGHVPYPWPCTISVAQVLKPCRIEGTIVYIGPYPVYRTIPRIPDLVRVPSGHMLRGDTWWPVVYTGTWGEVLKRPFYSFRSLPSAV